MFGNYQRLILPIQIRLYQHLSRRQSTLNGVVVGMAVHKKESLTKDLVNSEDRVLSKSAALLDKQCEGRILDALNKSKPLKPSECRILYGVHENYDAIAVVGVSGGCNNDYLEMLNIERERARQAAAVGVNALNGVGINTVTIEGFGHPDAAAEGSTLALFKFDELKTKKKSNPEMIVSYLNDDSSQEAQSSFNEGIILAKGQNLARRLMELPSNLLTPTKFAEHAQELFEPFTNAEVIVRDAAWAEETGMEAFLAVAKGSVEPLKFLDISYMAGQHNDVPPVVLIGKGVTFDSGGISIKPSQSMDKMRADMGGAACVLSAVYTLCQLEKCPEMSVRALIPLVENMPGGGAVKPGDVVRAMNGKTIQIDNTDAEGRLILADALAYADTFLPAHVIDVATLTGAMAVALGSGAAGTFTNSTELWRVIKRAGIHTGERVWRMPLYGQYERALKSQLADINNIAKPGTGAGACTAAAFLKNFTNCSSWSHIDIAGVMEGDGDLPYLSKGMTGRPTRLLVELLKTIASQRELFIGLTSPVVDRYRKH